MSERSTFWLSHLSAIEAEGITTKAYAEREGLSPQALYQWRKRTPLLHDGKLMHFAPANDDTYVYFRYAGTPQVPGKSVMVALNKGKDAKPLALDRFAAIDPQKAELVKLRYFAGLTIEEAADALGISPATAKRYWNYSRAWLFRAVAGDDPGERGASAP